MVKIAERQQEPVGLTSAEAAAQQRKGLGNQITENGQTNLGKIIRRNLFTWLNFFQFGIGVLVALTGSYINLLYLVVVSFNIISGIVQEWRAQRVTNQLAILAGNQVLTRRDGQTIKLNPAELVLNDVIELTAGDQISADAIVISGQLFANEALLTGEVDSITKENGAQLLSGSFVVSGKAYARINRIGKDNFAMQLTLQARTSQRQTSPILKSMQTFNHIASVIMLPLGAALFAQSYLLRGTAVHQIILNTATALLGILPIGVQLLLGVSFIAGALWLSLNHVLVHDGYALAALSRTDVLCLDKTGTITEGKLTVADVHEIKQPAFGESLNQVLQNFITATDDNNTTFQALENYFGGRNDWPVSRKIPFSSDQKWSAVSFDKLGTIITGAPEKFANAATPDITQSILAAQRDGKRLICVGQLPADATTIDPGDAEILAVIAFNDKIRTNVQDVLDYCAEQKIAVKVISGDNPVTIANVGAQAGIKDSDRLVDMASLSDDDITANVAANNTIFGRVTPNQKLKLIRALQSENRTVTMVGDGVNDVLALRSADCGVAMNSGSPAARQAAQLVLLNNDFGNLPALINEGRRVINIITSVSSLFFVKVIYSFLLALVCLGLNVPFPFLPIEITLIDLLIEGYPTFFLQFSNDKRPVKKQPLGYAFSQALPFAIAITIGVGALLAMSGALGLPTMQIRTIAFYIVIWNSLFSLITICRPYNLLKTILAVVSVIVVFIATYLFQHLIGLTVSSITANFVLIGHTLVISLLLYLVSYAGVRLVKLLRDKRSKNRAEQH